MTEKVLNEVVHGGFRYVLTETAPNSDVDNDCLRFVVSLFKIDPQSHRETVIFERAPIQDVFDLRDFLGGIVWDFSRVSGSTVHLEAPKPF